MTSLILALLARFVARGRILLVNDAGPVQLLQVKCGANDTRDNVQRLAEYGLQSNPPPNSDCTVISIGGDPTGSVVIATGHQSYRMQLAAGEVVLHDDKGQHVHLSAAGIRIFSDQPVLVDAPGLHCTGDITSDGDIVAEGDVKDQGGGKTMSGMRAAYNGHHHGGSTTPDLGM